MAGESGSFLRPTFEPHYEYVMWLRKSIALNADWPLVSLVGWPEGAVFEKEVTGILLEMNSERYLSYLGGMVEGTREFLSFVEDQYRAARDMAVKHAKQNDGEG